LKFTLYIGSKKAKHTIEYIFSKYACIIISRAKRDTIWTKYQEDQDTSREKAIPGAPKWLIPGAFWFAFWFASDLYAGGNAYRWRIL
jgi:hypothetical protein